MSTIIKKIFIAMLIAVFINVCTPCSKVFRAGDLSSSCAGSLTIYDDVGSTSLFTYTKDSLREGLRVSMVKLEGCGCYVLYEGSYRKGRKALVTRRGKQRIKLDVVKSVFREDCNKIEVHS